MKTVHYVCPSIWAWRRKRAARFSRSMDLMLALFPFEPRILLDYHVPCRFVGHPLADRIAPDLDRAAVRRTLAVEDGRTVVAVLPGSRGSELARIGPELARTVARLAASRPELVFLSPAASPAMAARFSEVLATHAPGVAVGVETGASTAMLAAADVAIVASGTATLEAVLTRTPTVVVYRIATVTHFLVHALGWMAVDSYSLPNALADERIVPELMQDDFEAGRVAEETLALLDDAGRRNRMIAAFAAIHDQLRCGASEQAADAIVELVAGT